MEMRGIEPRAFHMQSERSTTELHPLPWLKLENLCRNTAYSAIMKVHLVETLVLTSARIPSFFISHHKYESLTCLRPYHVENTSSRPITEVKQH